MEGTLNKAFTYILSVIIFFVYPVYITYEKKDDITHALVSKATHLFVDNVRSKGYISQGMLEDYVDLINSTGNKYEIKFLHTKKRYDPVVYFYKMVETRKENGVPIYELQKTDEMSYEEFEPVKAADSITIKSNTVPTTYYRTNTVNVNGKTRSFAGWKKTTKVSKEYFSNDMIIRKLNPDFMDKVVVPGNAPEQEKRKFNSNGIRFEKI